MKVLLTGAFGNLGVSTIRELLRQGHEVRCFDIPSPHNKKAAGEFNGKIDIIWGDIRDKNLVKQAVSGQEAVIHNAAVLPPLTDTKPGMAYEINVGGTQSLIEAIEASSSKAVLIYSSSVTVHGPSGNRTSLLKATDPLIPTDNYSTHKVECENMLKASTIPWVILRIGVSVDPETRNADPGSLRMLYDLSPDTRLEYVSPLDVAKSQVNAVNNPDAVNKVFLVGGGKSCRITFPDLIGAVFEALGIGNVPKEAFGSKPYYTDWMDTEESQKYLKYQSVSFDDYRKKLKDSLRLIRWTTFPIRPLVRMKLLQYSTPWKNRKMNRPHE